MLYVTPEYCQTQKFRQTLSTIHHQGQLTRVAIDEAHCVSDWGHDFRPAYKDLCWLKKTLILPSVPIIALTATATARVREDVMKCLCLDPTRTRIFSTTTARPNIHYEVQYFSESLPRSTSGDDLFTELVSWLTGMATRRHTRLSINPPEQRTPDALAQTTGIIYVPTRNLADNLSRRLNALSPPILAQAYHARLEPLVRSKVQDSFLHPAPCPLASPTEPSIPLPFNIIVATTAFGMGIDAPHVRFVLHYGVPRGFEQFVQESGRAGRDGKAAASIIFYTREERDRVAWRISSDSSSDAGRRSNSASQHQVQAKKDSFTAMAKFCETTSACRHRLVSDYFAGSAREGSQGLVTMTQPVCYYACDFCKEGPLSLKKRMEKGLASEQESMDFTQRERQTQVADYDPYDYYE